MVKAKKPTKAKKATIAKIKISFLTEIFRRGGFLLSRGTLGFLTLGILGLPFLFLNLKRGKRGRWILLIWRESQKENLPKPKPKWPNKKNKAKKIQ